MDLESVYYQIKERLIDAYQLTHLDDEDDQICLVKCQATALTRLYLLISVKTENSYINLSNKDSLSVLIYDATNQIITDPLSIPPLLVLHILHDRIYRLDKGICAKFSGVEETMNEWLADYRKRRQANPGEYPALPELRWSDLPNELFGLITGN